MTIRRRFRRDLGRGRNFDVFLMRLTRFVERGGAKRNVSLEPHGEDNRRGEESIHLTRLLTHKGSADDGKRLDT